MFGKLLKYSVLLPALLFMSLMNATSQACANGIQSKIDTVMNVWLHSREDFQDAIHLETSDIPYLKRRYLDEKSEQSKESIELLLAVNCIDFPENNRFQILYSYRCGHSSFERLSSSAVSSLDRMYQFIFVKNEDIERTVSFLNRYIHFWNNETSQHQSGIVLATDSQEYLLEIIDYLQYRKQIEQ